MRSHVPTELSARLVNITPEVHAPWQRTLIGFPELVALDGACRKWWRVAALREPPAVRPGRGHGLTTRRLLGVQGLLGLANHHQEPLPSLDPARMLKNVKCD